MNFPLKRHLCRKDIDMDICSLKCYGIDDYHGSCCSIENRNYVIGPIDDAKEFVSRLKNKFGDHIQYSDIFIEHDEGSKLFPEKSHWQSSTSFPAMRININSEKKECIFYNTTIRKCMVYDIRPTVCKRYKCQYLKDNESV